MGDLKYNLKYNSILLFIFFVLQSFTSFSIEKTVLVRLNHPKNEASQSLITSEEIEKTIRPIESYQEFQASLLTPLKERITQSRILNEKYQKHTDTELYQAYVLQRIYQSLGQNILIKIIEDYALKKMISIDAHERVIQTLFKSLLRESYLNQETRGAFLGQISDAPLPPSVSPQLSPLDYNNMYEALKKKALQLHIHSPHATHLIFQTKWLYAQSSLDQFISQQTISLSLQVQLLASNSGKSTDPSFSNIADAFYLTLQEKDSWPPLFILLSKNKKTGQFLPDSIEDFYESIKKALNDEHKKIAYKTILLSMINEKKKNKLSNPPALNEIQNFVLKLFKENKATLVLPSASSISFCPLQKENCIETALQKPELMSEAMFQPLIF